MTAGPGGWIAVGEDRGRQRLQNLRTGKSQYMRRGHDGFGLAAPTAMTITGDELLISNGHQSGDPDGILFVYRIASGRMTGRISAHTSNVYCLASDDDGRVWSTSRDRSIQILDPEKRTVLCRLFLDRSAAYVAPLPDGTGVLVGDMTGRVSRFDLTIPDGT